MPTALVLPLPVEVAARLALSIEGALPAGDLHLTLAMLDRDAPELALAVAALAASTAPVRVVLSGVGRFTCPDGRDAFHATVDGPTLPALRAAIEALFEGDIDRTHGFDPHVTLAYLAPDAPSPMERLAPVPVLFTELAIWDGVTRTSFPFAAMNPTATLDAIALPDAPPSELKLFADGWNRRPGTTVANFEQRPADVPVPAREGYAAEALTYPTTRSSQRSADPIEAP